MNKNMGIKREGVKQRHKGTKAQRHKAAKEKVWRALGLSDKEYQKILKILKRKPTPTELAMFSVEWSEHCGYPRSRKWLKLFPQKGKFQTLIGEDSGGIIVDDLAIIFKMESHNHPSQVEPKQGAATGIGGIIRDIFTAGARPIACLDSLRFGPLTDAYNRYLLNGVVDGIQFYGNCLGVPTVGGEIYFDENYSGNCLVNVMSVGIAHKDKLAKAKAFGVDNSIMYVGSSTGRDGIGGCSILASHEFKKDEEKRPTVQIGDPFTEKCLIEATLEALTTGYVVGVKDMGAAGLTCSSSEMAAAGNSGMEIELSLVPRREANMQPWELMMSESQERMLVCIKKGKEKEIEKIFSKWDLHAVVIGKVTADRMMRVKDKGKVIARVKAKALTDAPVYDMPSEKPDYLDELNKLNIKTIPEPADFNGVLLKLLSSPSIACKSWVYEQYDHMVQTNTLALPGSGAAVLKLKGTNKAIAVTTDCNGRYCFLNPYKGAQIAVAEAARNLICSGAEPAGLTDCLNFGNPEKPDRFWQFKNSVKGIADICKSFRIPVISGNVSFYNESPKGAIYPTPTIGMVGVIDNINRICSPNFKKEENVIILLGICKEEVGGSSYLKEIHKLVKGTSPDLDLRLEKAVQRTALEAIRKGLAASAQDCSEGGLAIALAECCISNAEKMVGATIDNLHPHLSPPPSRGRTKERGKGNSHTINSRTDALLFGESQSRIILSCEKKNLAKIKSIARKYNAPVRIIGKTGGKKLKILANKSAAINLTLETMRNHWRDAIKKRLGK